VHVSADQSQCYELFASLCFEISETGRSEVQAQLDEVLDECATSTYSDPGDSPIGTRSYEVVGGSGSWSIDAYPAVTVEGGWEDRVFSTHSAQVTGNATSPLSARRGWTTSPWRRARRRRSGVSWDSVLTEDGQAEIELAT